MKKLVTMFLVGIGFSGVALDVNDPITHIGKGTRLVAEEDFVVPANTSSLMAVNGKLLNQQPSGDQMQGTEFNSGHCRFHIVKSPRTRILPKGKALVVKGAASDSNAVVFASEHVRAVTCTAAAWSKPQVAQLLRHIEGLFDLEEAAPEVIE